jgi:predicted nuclease of predicted toxin-antitoxin system
VKLLLDNNLSVRLASALNGAVFDAVHVRDLGLAAAEDAEVLARAESDKRILVSADSDFGTLLAATRAARPSVVFLRRTNGRRFDEIASLLTANLPEVAVDLRAGAMVVIGQEEMRVRRLPLR